MNPVNHFYAGGKGRVQFIENIHNPLTLCYAAGEAELQKRINIMIMSLFIEVE